MKRRTLLVAGFALGCDVGSTSTLPARIAAGSASSVAPGTLKALPGEGVAIGRDSGGIYALSLICTHEGCDISNSGFVAASGIQCDCHGAVFDAQGNVLRGPARSSLVHFAVTEDAAGQLTIHTDQEVPSATRLPPA
jgi:Rieske Fe-S protein